ncbi:flagellar hook-length control protein FliK [Enterobacter sp. BIGb0383]|uniref:flagellar hook-length control protein FliK n=1 Tax=unclassified Enterobacter TaxID=2608935 RepID=UPI000FA9DD22|nr:MULTISPECIES: flagellar hook-length control protein FliK [unclassified Enterobacter]ROP58333.1 flagellar hook-length control protein FliK [Enterobacter sp. BIGb0383]ROS06779.1 flagellar hook-length control protein FliK [Enterobacter sp. BIGb0359]
MIVAKIAVAGPTGAPASSPEKTPSEGPQFASVLGEKQAAQTPGVKQPPAAPLHKMAERTRPVDEEDTANSALLTLLNQTLDASVDVKEEDGDNALPSLTDSADGQNVPPSPDGIPPLLPIAGSDAPSTELPAETDALTAAQRLPGMTPAGMGKEPVTETGENSAFRPHISASGKSAEPDAGVSTVFSPSETVKSPLPAIEAHPPAEKVDTFSHESERAAVTPTFAPLADVTATAAHASEMANTPATGALAQTMGTPAWQQSLGQQIACFTRGGVQHAELRLHPEELGSIQINLQLKDEQAQLHFVAASHQVRAALEAAVPHLRTSLAESGIELGQSSVGAETFSGWNDPARSGQTSQEKFAGEHSQDPAVLTEEVVETPVRTVSYNHGVNIFA